MARPICWECGNQLMYHNGKPVSKIIVVDGVKHRVHLQCKPDSTQQDARDDIRKAFCTTGCKP